MHPWVEVPVFLWNAGCTIALAVVWWPVAAWWAIVPVCAVVLVAAAWQHGRVGSVVCAVFLPLAVHISRAQVLPRVRAELANGALPGPVLARAAVGLALPCLVLLGGLLLAGALIEFVLTHRALLRLGKCSVAPAVRDGGQLCMKLISRRDAGREEARSRVGPSYTDEPLRDAIREAVRCAFPFFVSVPHGSLHIADLCLRFFPADAPVFVILDELAPWEKDWAHKHLAARAVLQAGRHLWYHQVMDTILDALDRPFALCDADCFVVDPGHFDTIRALDPETSFQGFYCRYNERLKLNVLETFFLAFNTPVINALRRKYGEGCSTAYWHELSDQVKNRLVTLGISAENLPHPGHRYFDTCKVLMMLGTADGMQCKALGDYPTRAEPYPDLLHVGGTGRVHTTRQYWTMRGAYLWQKVLAMHPDRALRECYQSVFTMVPTVEEVLADPECREKVGPGFFRVVDEFIEKAPSKWG